MNSKKYIQDYFDYVTTGMAGEAEQRAALQELKEHISSPQYERVKIFEHQRRHYINLISDLDIKDCNFGDTELELIKKATAEHEAAIDSLPAKPKNKVILYENIVYGKEKFALGADSIYDTMEKQLKLISSNADNDLYVGNIIYHAGQQNWHSHNPRKLAIMALAYKKLHDKQKFPKDCEKYLAEYKKHKLNDTNKKNRDRLDEINRLYKMCDDSRKKIDLLLEADSIVTHSGGSRIAAFRERSAINSTLSELYGQIGDMDNKGYYSECAEKWRRNAETALRKSGSKDLPYFKPQHTY